MSETKSRLQRLSILKSMVRAPPQSAIVTSEQQQETIPQSLGNHQFRIEEDKLPSNHSVRSQPVSSGSFDRTENIIRTEEILPGTAPESSTSNDQQIFDHSSNTTELNILQDIDRSLGIAVNEETVCSPFHPIETVTTIRTKSPINFHQKRIATSPVNKESHILKSRRLESQAPVSLSELFGKEVPFDHDMPALHDNDTLTTLSVKQLECIFAILVDKEGSMSKLKLVEVGFTDSIM